MGQPSHGEDDHLDVAAIKRQWEALTDLQSRCAAMASVMQRHIKCVELQEMALNALAQIFEGPKKANPQESPENPEARMAWPKNAQTAHIFAAIVQSMKAHTLSSMVQTAALRTLKALTEVGTAVPATNVVSKHCASAVVAAMTLHPASVEIQELACTFIAGALGYHAGTDQAYWDAGALQAVLFALRGSLATQNLQRGVCEALEHFALMNRPLAQTRERMLHAGCAEAMMACMEANPDHAEIQHAGANVLTLLADTEREDLQQMFLDKGCFKALFAYMMRVLDKGLDRGEVVEDSLVQMLVCFVRSARADQLMQMMKAGALEALLAYVKDDPYTGILGVLTELGAASATNSDLKALLRDAGVFAELVQSLKAEPDLAGNSDGPPYNSCPALSELADSCEDLLCDLELREKLRPARAYFFRVTLVSGSSCAVVLQPMYNQSDLIQTVVRKLHLNPHFVENAESTLLLGSEPLPDEDVEDWGLESGEVYDIQLVLTTKRRRLTEIDTE
mmetsp:Transcript_56253/g.134052  ORF Transcript_56253/g.134052 Transcript_56253/m.134052 type:complete len:507 (-) Transcript_56253:134-1654(-)